MLNTDASACKFVVEFPLSAWPIFVSPRLSWFLHHHQFLDVSTWSWPSGWCIGLRSWLRGIDAQLGHLEMWLSCCNDFSRAILSLCQWLVIQILLKIALLKIEQSSGTTKVLKIGLMMNVSEIIKSVQCLNWKIKSSLFSPITPKWRTNGGVHLRGLASGQHRNDAAVVRRRRQYPIWPAGIKWNVVWFYGAF